MRIWHNISWGLDVVEYIPKKMYGVITYKEGMEKELGNHRWLATMMGHQAVEEYIEWCDLYCDKIIYNAWTKKDGDNEWL